MNRSVIQLFWVIGLLGLLILPVKGMAQRGRLPLDTVAINFVEQGKYFLEIGNPELALDAFKAAYNRPTHQLSSTALYFWGLSSFNLDNMSEAELVFRQFMDLFPDSKYAEDSRYHLSRSLLDSWQDTAAFMAFEDLMMLKDSASTVLLRKDAKDALDHYIYFDAEDERLEYIIERLPLNEQLFLLDALAYRLYQNNDFVELRQMYDFYKENHNYFSPFIERMFTDEKIVRYVDPGVFKIAVIIPGKLNESWLDSSKLPRSKILPIEYYEGLAMGMKDYIRVDSNKVYVEVLDSRRDSLTTELILNRLESLRPDLIVGDIYNAQSRIIGTWAEYNLIPQLVPLSPSRSLAQSKSQVFIAHPSAREHGQSMALYAHGYLNLKNVAVFRDGTNSTEQLAYAFTENFKTLGGTVLDIKVPSKYDKTASKKIIKEVRKLKKAGVKGVYIPIQGNQESAGLVLSQMKALDYKMKVMGGPHWWNRYNTVDRELKNSYELICSTSYFVNERNPEYQNFFRNYLKNYDFPPGQYSVQGYDIGHYLMEMVEKFPHGKGDNLADFMRAYPPFYGLHFKIDFRGQQVNQSVNLLQFNETGTECLNCKEKLGIEPLFRAESILDIRD
ncbi:MAG: ABC transporter substrate-binding protein [Bacteroidia bacterium]|nr:ABC transporter substrate-binding protein [Bacteroidia bacterium]